MIEGKYKYDQMLNGAPVYKRSTMPRMYLYRVNDQWVMWKNIGQTYYCDPWWAFWNCHEVYGLIRHESENQCPGNLDNQWNSGLTQSIDTTIQVKCTKEDSKTTTVKPGES